MQSMTELQRSAIRRVRRRLVADMMTQPLLDSLVARETISEDDEERVRHEVTTQDKNRKLLDILRSKPSSSFDDLIISLEDINQPHLAALLVNESRSATGRVRGRSISEIGNLLIAGGVPLEPEVFIERIELTERIRNAISAMLKSGKPGWILIYGPGGIGKTTLVAQALRQSSLVDSFANGVIWLKVGKLKSNEELLIKMNTLLTRLSVDRVAIHTSNLDEAHLRLRSAMVEERPNTLLILDDLWDDRMAKWFSVGAQVLVTSRDATVLDRVQGHVEKVEIRDGLTEDQSNSVFSRTLDIQISELPQETKELWSKCGGSPLAISMLAALLKGKRDRWAYYLRLLNERRFDRMKIRSDYDHDTLDAAIEISIENLPDDQRERYKRLAVFQRGVLLSPTVLATLWSDEEPEEAEDIMNEFVVKSLAWREYNEEKMCDMFGIHDLQHSWLRALADKELDKKQLHQELLESYRRKCAEDKWSNLPNDGYIFWFICMHLFGAGKKEELTKLLTNLEFVEAKLIAAGPTDVVNDYMIYEKLFSEFGLEDVMQTYFSFVRRHANLLVGGATDLRGKVIQLGLCQDTASVVFKDALNLAKARCGSEGPFWLWRNTKMAPTNVLFSAKVGKTFIHSVDINKSGTRILVSNHDGQVFLLSAKTGHEICVFQVDESEVYRATFVGDGSSFICCSDSGFIRVLAVPETSMREPPARMSSGGDGVDHCLHGGPACPVAERGATAEEMARQAIRAEYPRGDSSPGHQPQLQPRCCCVGANVVFVGCQDGTLARYYLQEGQIYFGSEIPNAHHDAIMAVALSRCGLFVATGGVDRQGRVYDLEELEFMSTYSGHSAGLTACLLVPGKAENAVTAAANEIHVWRINNATNVRKLLGPRNVTFMSLAISKDARYLAAGMSNNAITLFNFSQGERLWELWGHKGSPLSLCFDAHDERLLSVGDDATLLAWDLSLGSGTYRRLDKVMLQVKSALAVHWAPSGWSGTLVAAQDSHSGSLLLMDADKCDILYTGPRCAWKAERLAFTADGRRLAVGSDTSTVVQMTLERNEEGKLEVNTLNEWCATTCGTVEERQAVSCLRFVSETGTLVVGLLDGQVWLLPATGAARRLGQHQARVSVLLEYSGHVLSASYDARVRRWSMVEGDVGAVVCKTSDSILSVDVLPERRWLVTALTNARVEVWQMEDDGPALQLSVFEHHKDCVRVARFCPSDPGRIATADDRGTVWVWRAPYGKDARELTRFSVDLDSSWTNDLVWCGPERLLTVSSSMRAWDVSGTVLQTFHPRGSQVVQVSVRPGHGFDELVAVDSAGTLYLLESVH